MTNAVIVSTARTPLAKSWKGAFNMTHGATLGGHAVRAAVERAGMGNLAEGQKVSYEEQRDPKRGKTSAENLKAV